MYDILGWIGIAWFILIIDYFVLLVVTSIVVEASNDRYITKRHFIAGQIIIIIVLWAIFGLYYISP